MPGIKAIIKKLLQDKEFVTFYPTYGYREGNDWKIPLRIWVHEPRKLAEELVLLLADTIGDIEDFEQNNLAIRIADIVADSESLEKVVFQFDNDPYNVEWRVQSEDDDHPRSDLNGIIDGYIILGDAHASALLNVQNAQNNWLTFRAISTDHSGIGRVRLIEPQGLSVISDIDDTMKISEIPAGGKVIVRNAFFRDYVAAPGMVKRYKSLENASFHYVSGGPWQLFKPLSDFIRNEGFPEGTFHMKSVPKNLLSPRTWKHLLKLIGDATIDQKIAQISEIMHKFPQRKFIFVGDSGEHDPEVYSQLRKTFDDQVKEIWIRDVINARKTDPSRLHKMKIIEASNISKGIQR